MHDDIEVTREEDEAWEQLVRRLEEAQENNAELAEENWRLAQVIEDLKRGAA
ncbi:hypothetical protein [Halomonas sp. IOP_31]|uniref:hypothetical protein n=1 Tax=Halomonas sp. IOP_31 TaxID=2876584 RepID=UPI001E2D0099|nr:hypothetical protein [Halomonas sp. IOP_31]MCD6006857.1 hypothetical protein [Halomonas sp. IOP_31]